VDTSAYRARAQAIYKSGVIVAGQGLQLAGTLARIDELLAALQARAAQVPPEQPEILVEETDRLKVEVR
jgi:hypothetical protein